MKFLTFVYLLLGILVLSACGDSETGPISGDLEETATSITSQSDEVMAGQDSAGPATADADSMIEPTSVAEVIANAEPVTALTVGYQDALPVNTQLAVGMLQLEGTDRAVTADQAGELLPLWQLLNTLQTSGTAADVELEAVAKQIQSVLTPDQLGAIATLKLTTASLADLMSAGGLGFGRGAMNGDRDPGNFAGMPEGAVPEGFVPPAGGGMGPGAGAGPGAGTGPGAGGGGMGGELGGLDPAMMATRQAELASGDNSAALDQVAFAMVIRLMQVKTGEFAGMPNGGIFNVMVAAVAEATGLEEAAVREALQAGKTPNELIAEYGVDLTAVRETILTDIEGMTLPESQSPETIVDGFLAGTMDRGSSVP